MANENAISSDTGTLRLELVDKHFDAQRVIEHLSLEIRIGEIFTLLGASGCGKTTTLRIIAGLERPSAGRVIFRDKTWVDVERKVFTPPQKRSIGMVFQSYAIWPHMTVFDHVAYPLRIAKMNRNEVEERVTQVLEIVGLTGFERRPAVQLSGGQQQRVAVARAVAHEPDLLLLDEPFSNLDVGLREQLRVELREIQRRLGVTVILVTHDQLDAFTLSDRIGIMRNGRIEQIDEGRQVYERPRNTFVREFVGNSVVFKGILADETERAWRIRLADGTTVEVTRDQGGATFEPGAPVCIWSRPEDLAVTVDTPDNDSRGKVRGLVERAVFLGNSYGCTIRLADGGDIWTYVPRVLHPRAGMSVLIEISPVAAQLVRD